MNIVEGKTEAPRRALVYGVNGIGKSTFLSNAPKPILIPTEEGLNDIDVHHFRLAESFEEVMADLKEVYETKTSYKTLGIDTLDALERLIWTEVCKDGNKTNIEEFGYQHGYQFAVDKWQKFLDALDIIRREKGMTILLSAHATVAAFNDPETESYSRWVPALHKLASGLVCGWSDEVLFLCFKIFTKAEDKGFNQKRTRGIGQGERIIKTTERPGHVAKNRLGLPDEIPLSWAEYAKFLNGAPKKVNGHSKDQKPEPKKEEVKHG